MTANEKRHFHRIDFTNEATLTIDEKNWTVELIDLSLNGILISCTDTIPNAKNSKGKLFFKIKGEDVHIETDIKVMHCHDDKFGLSIQNISLDSMRHLKRIVELNTADPSLLDRELNELINLHLIN